jgi:hypothetical protein
MLAILHGLAGYVKLNGDVDGALEFVVWKRKSPQPRSDSPVRYHGLGFASDIINIPSRNFMGLSSKSPNGRFTIARMDGGPDRSRRGGFIFHDHGKL